MADPSARRSLDSSEVEDASTNNHIQRLLEVIHTIDDIIMVMVLFYQDLLVDDLKNLIQEYRINPSKSRKKAGALAFAPSMLLPWVLIILSRVSRPNHGHPGCTFIPAANARRY